MTNIDIPVPDAATWETIRGVTQPAVGVLAVLASIAGFGKLHRDHPTAVVRIKDAIVRLVMSPATSVLYLAGLASFVRWYRNWCVENYHFTDTGPVTPLPLTMVTVFGAIGLGLLGCFALGRLAQRWWTTSTEETTWIPTPEPEPEPLSSLAVKRIQAGMLTIGIPGPIQVYTENLRGNVDHFVYRGTIHNETPSDASTMLARINYYTCREFPSYTPGWTVGDRVWTIRLTPEALEKLAAVEDFTVFMAGDWSIKLEGKESTQQTSSHIRKENLAAEVRRQLVRVYGNLDRIWTRWDLCGTVTVCGGTGGTPWDQWFYGPTWAFLSHVAHVFKGDFARVGDTNTWVLTLDDAQAEKLIETPPVRTHVPRFEMPAEADLDCVCKVLSSLTGINHVKPSVAVDAGGWLELRGVSTAGHTMARMLGVLGGSRSSMINWSRNNRRDCNPGVYADAWCTWVSLDNYERLRYIATTQGARGVEQLLREMRANSAQ